MSGLNPVFDAALQEWPPVPVPDDAIAEFELFERQRWYADAPIRPEAQELVREATARVSPLLGVAARDTWHARAWAAMVWASRLYASQLHGAFGGFAQGVLRTAWFRFVKRYTPRRLRRELDDERTREQAARSEAVLLKYLESVARRLTKMQRVDPGKWRVRGLTAEEAREEIGLRLLETLKSPDGLREFERVGCDATFVFVAKTKDVLRRERRVFLAADGPVLSPESPPTPEDALLSSEQVALSKRYEDGLNNPTVVVPSLRKWVAAFRADITWHDDLNVARAAKQLDRHRSSGTRALSTLARRLRRWGMRTSRT